MSDPISDYQAKLQDFQAATNAIERMVQQIHDGSRALETWRKVMVSNNSGFPAELLYSTLNKNARDWPTGQQIGERLSQWHALRNAVRAAYRQIPDAQRGVIQPPPE